MIYSGNDHELRRPLKEAINGITDPDEVVEAVLMLLNERHYISYRSHAVPLLGPLGRVLADLALHPQTTVREMAIRIGISQPTVTAHMTNLVKENLIERTKVGRSNRYRIPLISLLSHPDIRGLLTAVMNADRDSGSDSEDNE